MITSKYISTVCVAFAILMLSTGVRAANTAPPATMNCDVDLDACVRTVIAENFVFADECGKAYPRSRAEMDSALQRWTVLKLKIPGIEEALEPKSKLRSQLRDAVTPYFKRIPDYEREIECAGRLEMLRSAEPKLQGDFARLPNGVLRKYARR
jgi:hypothetical protein